MLIGRYFDISKAEAGRWYVVHHDGKPCPAISVPGPYPRFVVLSNKDAVLIRGGTGGVYFIPDGDVVPDASAFKTEILGAYLIPDVELVPETMSIRTEPKAATGSIIVTKHGSFFKFRTDGGFHYLNLQTLSIEEPESPFAWFSKWSLCAKRLDGYEVLLNFGS